MTASERQTRVFNGALKLFLHRTGPGASLDSSEIDRCVAFCAALEAKVESALKGDI